MAAASEEEEISSNDKISHHPLNNNQVVNGETNKDLLRVRPERGLEKYLLKNSNKTGVPQKTFKVSPCQALRQVKEFLPVMEKAQATLSKKDINIEDVNESEPYINMDLQLVELEESSTESESSDEPENQNVGEVTLNNFVVTKPNSTRKTLIEDIT